MERGIITCEGIVYRDGYGYHIHDVQDGVVSLSEALKPLTAYSQVEFLGQHFPEQPLNKSLWGGGCCFWQSSGHCPAGHHERPGYLYQYSETGKLEDRAGEWHMEGKPIPFHMLNGHRCRLVAVPKLDPKDLHCDIEGMEELKALQDRLENLKKIFGGNAKD